MIIIKPHHFFDIIKLYGAGIDEFVPDKEYMHDFYLIGNKILKNKNLELKITIKSDDICNPCIFCRDNQCIDSLSIGEFTKKELWNAVIDTRIIKYADLKLNKIYTSNEFCQSLYNIRTHIHDIWKEEDSIITNKRYNYFLLGANKYLLK